MKLFRNATYACTLILLSFNTQAQQQYALQESTADVKGPQHILLSCADGGYITITYPFADDNDPIIVSRFDHTLNAKYSNPIDDLKKENYQSCLYNNGRLALFCNDKEGNVSLYNVDDHTGALAGAPAALFTLEAKEADSKFHVGSAPGKAFNYFVARQRTKKEKGTFIQGVILDQQYNRLATFTVVTPEEAGDLNNFSCIQGDDGALYMIYSVNVKSNKDDYTPQVYKVIMVDSKGATRNFPINGLPKGNLNDMAWSIDGTRLSFTGLISHSKKSGFTTVFTGSLDFQKRKGSFHQTEINTLMANVPDYLKQYRDDGIPTEASLIKTLTLNDGSHVLILEDNGNYTYQSHYAPMSPSNPGFSSAPSSLRMGTMSSYSIVYYNRGNVYVVKTDGNNIPQWVNVITKNQREADMAIAIGTACTVDSKNNIHLFFVDNKKDKDPNCKKPKEVNGLDAKKNKLACVTITPTGNMTKEFIEQDEPKFRPMLEKSMSTGNELCFMAIKKKTAFSMEHMRNHAHYHFGTVRINPGQNPAMATN